MICLTDDGDVFVTDDDNNLIVRLFPTGSVTTVFSTAPLKPLGICKSTDGGLLVSLSESENFQSDSHSRSLVRHVTLAGDVIREYEYQEDGQTRLFTAPVRIKQNANTDIYVINLTSGNTSELVILSSSGSLKSVYSGQNLVKKFQPTDVVFDSDCNVIVSNFKTRSQIHLVSPEGKFIKYLLTETEVTDPLSMCLYKSTLWVSDIKGLVKVFHYNKT